MDSEQEPELSAASQPGGVQVRSIEVLLLQGQSRNDEEREEPILCGCRSP